MLSCVSFSVVPCLLPIFSPLRCKCRFLSFRNRLELIFIIPRPAPQRQSDSEKCGIYVCTAASSFSTTGFHTCAVPACPATGHPAVTPEWHNIPAFFTFDPIALENWYADDENSLLLQTFSHAAAPARIHRVPADSQPAPRISLSHCRTASLSGI